MMQRFALPCKCDKPLQVSKVTWHGKENQTMLFLVNGAFRVLYGIAACMRMVIFVAGLCIIASAALFGFVGEVKPEDEAGNIDCGCRK
jgi:hypothetical protein